MNNVCLVLSGYDKQYGAAVFFSSMGQSIRIH